MDICIRSATIPPITQVVVIEEVDLGLKIPATLILRIMDQVNVVMVELHIGLIPSTLHPITHAAVVYFWVALFFCTALKIVHGNDRCDQRGDYGRDIFISQETSHSLFFNIGASVISDGRVGYKSHTSHSPSYNPCGISIFLDCSVTYHPIQ